MNAGESAGSGARGGGAGGVGGGGASAFFPTTAGGATDPIRPTIRPERFSDPTNFSYQNYSSTVNGRVKSGHTSEFSQNFQTIEQAKKQQRSNAKANSALQAFDPLAPSKSVETLTETELSVNVSTSIGGSTQTLVPENMALSPDQGFASPGAHSDQSHFDSSSAPRDAPRDSGLPSESVSLDTISEDLGGLKLTEQQNVHIDAHRLSTAALSLFDPLMQESSTDPDDSEPHHPNSESNLSRPNKPHFNEQGARPKTTGALPVTPRISVQSSDADSARSLSAVFEHRRDGSSGRPLPDPEVLKNAAESDNVSMHSTDSASKLTHHRGSTDSSNSSLIDVSTPRTSRGEVGIHGYLNCLPTQEHRE